MLSVADLSQGYGKHTVLRHLSIQFTPGVTALVGPNGAGKTTLLRTLATVQPPQEGRLAIGGSPVTSEAEARRARRLVGFLPQSFGFDPGMRLMDFVRYGAWLRGVPSREWTRASRTALDYVGLVDSATTKMGRLSGGMRQRAGIAWAIVGRPRVVLLDEPTVGLDPEQRLRFRQILAGLRDTAVVLSTHLIDDVDAVCDRVVVMYGGAVRFDGTTSELRDLDDPSLPGHTPLERAYISRLPEGRDR